MKQYNLRLRLLTFVLAAVLVFSSVYTVAAENDTSVDTAFDIEYPEKETEVLSALGIINKKDYTEEGKTFTRAELASKMTAVINIKGVSEDVRLPFQDVDVNSKYYSDIAGCVFNGILNGVSATEFNPDKICTVTETVTVLMRALGYQRIAEAKGGYVTGYISQAAREGLLDNIPAAALDRECTNRIFARLVYNMLETDIYSFVGIDGEDLLFERGEAYMTEVFDVKKAKGVLEGTRVTNVLSGNAEKDGYIRIDGVVYECPGINPDEYLGYSVEAYYTDENESSPVVSYIGLSKKNEVTKIAKDDVTELSADKIEYLDENDSKETVSFLKSMSILYNNLPASSVEKIKNDGYYICIDNNGDGDIDVLRIEDYSNVFISTVNKQDGIIYDKYSSANNLSFSPQNVGKSVFIYNEEGESIGLENLETKIVYSCLRSENDKIIVIRGVINEVVGVVSEGETDKDGNLSEITVDGTVCSIAENVKSHLPDIEMGKTMLIGYLDVMGKLAAFDDISAKQTKFAFFYALDKAKGVKEGVSLKLYVAGNSKGKLTEYECADRVKVDEVSYKLSESDKLYSTLKNSEGELISFELDEEGKISTVGTISGGALIYCGGNSSDIFYNTRLGNLGIKSDCFVIFADPTFAPENFWSGTRGSLIKDQSYTNYSGYKTDVDEIGAEVLLIVSGSGGNRLAGDASHMVVTKATNAIVGSDGETGQKISDYVLGKMQSFTITDTTEIVSLNGEKMDAVQEGYVIRYQADTQENLDSVQVMYSLKDDKIFSASNPSNSNVYGKPRVLRAKAYKKTNDFILFTYTDPASASFNELTDTELRDLASNKAVYIYDKKAQAGNRISLGSLKDIVAYWDNGAQCSDLFAVTRGTLMETVIIIKN